MLEVVLLHHRRFVDVIVGSDAVVMRNLCQLAHVVHVVAADVDVEHHCVAIVMLPLNQVIEVRSDWFQRFRQRLSVFD